MSVIVKESPLVCQDQAIGLTDPRKFETTRGSPANDIKRPHLVDVSRIYLMTQSVGVRTRCPERGTDPWSHDQREATLSWTQNAFDVSHRAYKTCGKYTETIMSMAWCKTAVTHDASHRKLSCAYMFIFLNLVIFMFMGKPAQEMGCPNHECITCNTCLFLRL